MHRPVIAFRTCDTDELVPFHELLAVLHRLVFYALYVLHPGSNALTSTRRDASVPSLSIVHVPSILNASHFMLFDTSLRPHVLRQNRL